MLIHELKKSTGLKPKTQRVWRWNSCKRWNYCWRGMNWQKSRSWWNIPAYFEGWQTPLHMRLPKLRWFKRYFKLLDDIQVINLWDLCTDERLHNVDINKDLLLEYWYIPNVNTKVKILGNWICNIALKFVWINSISHSALKTLESAWWSFTNE